MFPFSKLLCPLPASCNQCNLHDHSWTGSWTGSSNPSDMTMCKHERHQFFRGISNVWCCIWMRAWDPPQGKAAGPGSETIWNYSMNPDALWSLWLNFLDQFGMEVPKLWNVSLESVHFHDIMLSARVPQLTDVHLNRKDMLETIMASQTPRGMQRYNAIYLWYIMIQ